MMTYFYKHTKSTKRGFNRQIQVFEQETDKSFSLVGCEDINTGSYKGDYAVACEVLHNKKGYRLSKDGYFLARKDIKLIEMP